MRNELDMLRQMLADGSISKEELQARLTVIIDAAYQRLPVDAAFIADCESLLQTIITGDTASSPSIAADCWRTVRANSRTRNSVSMGWKARFAIVAAVFLLLICLRELSFDRTWVGGRSAFGGTTYIIGTHRMEGGLSAATAKESTVYEEDWADLNTQSWDEFVAFLGYVPPTVNLPAFGLSASGSYYANVSDSSLYSSQFYRSSTYDAALRSLTITVIDYAAPEHIGFSFSQIHPGRNVKLSDGTEVYVTTQYAWGPDGVQSMISVTWLDGTRLCHLTGDGPEAEMLAVAEALCGQ